MDLEIKILIELIGKLRNVLKIYGAGGESSLLLYLVPRLGSVKQCLPQSTLPHRCSSID